MRAVASPTFRFFGAGLLPGLAFAFAVLVAAPASAQLLDELDKIAQPDEGPNADNNAVTPDPVVDTSSCGLRGIFVLETIPFGGGTAYEREYGVPLYWHPNGEVSVPAIGLGPGVVTIGRARPGFDGDWLYSSSTYSGPRRELHDMRALKCTGTSLHYDELATTSDPELMLESDAEERKYLAANPLRLKSALAGNGETLSGEIGGFHLRRGEDQETVVGVTPISRPWRMRRVETSVRLTVEDGSGQSISGSGAMKLAHNVPFRLHVDETVGVSAIAAFWPAGRPVLAESGRISLEWREGGRSSGLLRLVDGPRPFTRQEEPDEYDPESLDYRSYTGIPLAQGESIEISLDGLSVVKLTAYTLPELFVLHSVDESGRELASVAPGQPFRLEARFEFDHPEESIDFGIEGGGIAAGIDAPLGEDAPTPVTVERARTGPRLFRTEEKHVFRSESLAIALQVPAEDPLSFARTQPGYDAERAAQTAASLFAGEWRVEHLGALTGSASVAADGRSATLAVAGAAGERRYRSVEIDAAAFPDTDPAREIRQLSIRFADETAAETDGATTGALPLAVDQGSERITFVVDDLRAPLEIDAMAAAGQDRMRIFLLAKGDTILEGSWSEELNGSIVEQGGAVWKRLCGPSSLAQFEPVGEGGSCYFAGPDMGSWKDGQSFCGGHGGHLAIITSAEENALVAGLMDRCQNSNGCWIGATDEASEGNFVWVDGAPLSYAAWSSGEPNNYCSGEDYVHMMPGGSWNDQALDGGCSGWGLKNPICEVAAPERAPVQPVVDNPDGPVLRLIGLGATGLAPLSDLKAGEPFMVEARFPIRRDEESFTVDLSAGPGVARSVAVTRTEDAAVYRSVVIRIGGQ